MPYPLTSNLLFRTSMCMQGRFHACNKNSITCMYMQLNFRALQFPRLTGKQRSSGLWSTETTASHFKAVLESSPKEQIQAHLWKKSLSSPWTDKQPFFFSIKLITLRFSNTFSAEAPVSTNVEKTGRGYLLLEGQHSIVAPIGRQKRGTDSGNGNDS